jgi:hypothetical protein
MTALGIPWEGIEGQRGWHLFNRDLDRPGVDAIQSGSACCAYIAVTLTLLSNELA